MIDFNANVVMILSVLSATAFIIAHGIEAIRYPRRGLIIAATLRLASLVALIFLFHIFWRHSTKEKPTQRDVVLLDDVSGSMDLTSTAANRRRIDALKPQLAKTLNDADAETRRFFSFSFASDAWGEKPPQGMESRRATAIGDALLTVNRLHPGAIVLLRSDGLENAGESARMAARRLAAFETNVFPFKRSSLRNPDSFDVAISSVRHEKIPDNSTAPPRFSGIIERRGKKIDHCDLRLSIDAEPVAIHTVNLDANPKPFDLRPDRGPELKPGWHEYELTTIPLKGEVTSLNNSARGVFKISDDRGITLVWHYPDPDQRFLVHFLSGEYPDRLNVLNEAKLSAMTTAEQEDLITGNALLILGKIPPSAFKDQALRTLRKLILNQKTALVFFNPVILESWLLDPIIGNILPVKGINGDFAFKTPLRAAMPTTNGDEAKVPVHIGYNLIPKDADDVAVAAADRNGHSKPIVISDGRVTCLAALGCWRWALSPLKNVRFNAASFWNGFFNRFGQIDRAKLTLKVVGEETLPGGRRRERRVFKIVDHSKTSPGAAIALKQQTNDGTWRTVKDLGNIEGHSATIRHNVSAPGIHWFRAEKIGANGESLATSARVPIVLEDHNREMDIRGDGDGLLDDVAVATGGKRIDLDEVHVLIRELDAKTPKLKIKRGQPPNLLLESLLAAIVLLLLSLEWLLRQIEKNRISG